MCATRHTHMRHDWSIPATWRIWHTKASASCTLEATHFICATRLTHKGICRVRCRGDLLHMCSTTLSYETWLTMRHDWHTKVSVLCALEATYSICAPRHNDWSVRATWRIGLTKISVQCSQKATHFICVHSRRDSFHMFSTTHSYEIHMDQSIDPLVPDDIFDTQQHLYCAL